MEDNYPKAYKEVYEILKFVPKEDVQKIPDDFMKIIKNNMDRNYDYKVNPKVDFEDQEMLRETMAILAIIYRDYWATEKQREMIIKKQNYDIQKEEEKKRQLYNPNDLFENQEINKYETQEIDIHQEEVRDMVEYKQTWYMKFIEMIKRFIMK